MTALIQKEIEGQDKKREAEQSSKKLFKVQIKIAQVF